MLAGLRRLVVPRSRRNAVRFAVALAVVLVAAALLLWRLAPALSDPATVRRWVVSAGALGPAVLVVLQAAQVVFAPVPGHVFALLAGYLFGPVWGTLYCLLGATLGSWVALGLGRRYGRGYVRRVVSPETLARLDGVPEDRTLLAAFAVFLLPGVPDDVVCFAVGLTDVPAGRFLAVAALGRLPGYLVLTLVGSGIAEGDALRTALVAVVAAVAAVAGYALRNRLYRWLRR